MPKFASIYAMEFGPYIAGTVTRGVVIGISGTNVWAAAVTQLIALARQSMNWKAVGLNPAGLFSFPL